MLLVSDARLRPAPPTSSDNTETVVKMSFHIFTSIGSALEKSLRYPTNPSAMEGVSKDPGTMRPGECSPSREVIRRSLRACRDVPYSSSTEASGQITDKTAHHTPSDK